MAQGTAPRVARAFTQTALRGKQPRRPASQAERLVQPAVCERRPVRQTRENHEEIKKDGTQGAATAQPGAPHAQPSRRRPSTWNELDGGRSFQAAGAGRERVGYGAPWHLPFRPFG